MKPVIAALILLIAGPVSAASLCYGTIDGSCKAPALDVAQSASITLPADFEIDTDRQATFTLTLGKGEFVSPASVAGGSLLANSTTQVAATCVGPCVIALGSVAGYEVGDAVIADVRLFDPNGVTQTFFDGPVTLARVLGQYNAVAWVLNPASNLNQRTFLRIIAPDNAATVQLFATDDNGDRRGPVAIRLNAGESMQITPDDLENGNAAKGIDGFGSGVGKWRVDMTSDSRFRAIALSTGLSELPVD